MRVEIPVIYFIDPHIDFMDPLLAFLYRFRGFPHTFAQGFLEPLIDLLKIVWIPFLVTWIPL
jgi:hypothetical protein